MGLYADCHEKPCRFATTLTLPDGRKIKGNATTKPDETCVSRGDRGYLIPGFVARIATGNLEIPHDYIHKWMFYSVVLMSVEEQEIRMRFLGFSQRHNKGQIETTVVLGSNPYSDWELTQLRQFSNETTAG